jgi:microcystin-dependent protein
MSQPYVGEIRIFAGNFPPAGWMFCEGQLLPISEEETLFNLIGTTYGGDGQSTFALPDLRGRVPMHQGTGNGLGTATLAQTGGAETVTVTVNTMPAHSHPFLAIGDKPGTAQSPGGNLAAQSFNVTPWIEDVSGTTFSPNAITQVGGTQPHDNFQPYLCLDFIISLFGVFPSQT